MRNICTCTQIWTILSVLTKTKPNANPITFLKFLELIGKVYKTKEVQSTNCDCAYCPSYYVILPETHSAVQLNEFLSRNVSVNV